MLGLLLLYLLLHIVTEFLQAGGRFFKPSSKIKMSVKLLQRALSSKDVYESGIEPDQIES